MYYVYILRCRDGTLYTGISPDIKKRMRVHFSGKGMESKYVASRGAERLEVFWESPGRAEASRLEYQIKRLSREKKEKLISGEAEPEAYLGDRLDCSEYHRVDRDNIMYEIFSSPGSTAGI